MNDLGQFSTQKLRSNKNATNLGSGGALREDGSLVQTPCLVLCLANSHLHICAAERRGVDVEASWRRHQLARFCRTEVLKKISVGARRESHKKCPKMLARAISVGRAVGGVGKILDKCSEEPFLGAQFPCDGQNIRRMCRRSVDQVWPKILTDSVARFGQHRSDVGRIRQMLGKLGR